MCIIDDKYNGSTVQYNSVEVPITKVLRHSLLLLLLFKLKSIGVGGSVLSICIEFFSNSSQRVVVDGVTRELIPIVSGVPQVSVLGPLLFILYTCEIFEEVESRLYAYTDDSTLLAAGCSKASRHTCC